MNFFRDYILLQDNCIFSWSFNCLQVKTRHSFLIVLKALVKVWDISGKKDSKFLIFKLIIIQFNQLEIVFIPYIRKVWVKSYSRIFKQNTCDKAKACVYRGVSFRNQNHSFWDFFFQNNFCGTLAGHLKLTLKVQRMIL